MSNAAVIAVVAVILSVGLAAAYVVLAVPVSATADKSDIKKVGGGIIKGE